MPTVRYSKEVTDATMDAFVPSSEPDDPPSISTKSLFFAIARSGNASLPILLTNLGLTWEQVCDAIAEQEQIQEDLLRPLSLTLTRQERQQMDDLGSDFADSGSPIDSEEGRAFLRKYSALLLRPQKHPVRRAVELAYSEMRRTGGDSVEVRHLLVALIREQSGLIGRAFASLNVELDTVRHFMLD